MQHEKYITGKYNTKNTTRINGFPQERRITVNPLRGETEFLENETIQVNPNRRKQGGIPEQESLGIANNKSDPNGRQKELVPRRPRDSFLLPLESTFLGNQGF